MPNWCEGTLKIRGNFEDVKRWAKENIEVHRTKIVKKPDGSSCFDYVSVPEAIDYSYDELDSQEFCMEVKETAYIKGSRRHFIEPDVYSCFERDIKSTVFVLRFKAAWCIDEEPFVEMSKKYHVDFRLYGCEMGMEFNQEVVVENGEVVKNEEIKFDDYIWDCPFPDIGG